MGKQNLVYGSAPHTTTKSRTLTGSGFFFDAINAETIGCLPEAVWHRFVYAWWGHQPRPIIAALHRKVHFSNQVYSLTTLSIAFLSPVLISMK